jgi:hypothetical protein
MRCLSIFRREAEMNARLSGVRPVVQPLETMSQISKSDFARRY